MILILASFSSKKIHPKEERECYNKSRINIFWFLIFLSFYSSKLLRAATNGTWRIRRYLCCVMLRENNKENEDLQFKDLIFLRNKYIISSLVIWQICWKWVGFFRCLWKGIDCDLISEMVFVCCEYSNKKQFALFCHLYIQIFIEVFFFLKLCSKLTKNNIHSDSTIPKKYTKSLFPAIYFLKITIWKQK